MTENHKWWNHWWWSTTAEATSHCSAVCTRCIEIHCFYYAAHFQTLVSKLTFT